MVGADEVLRRPLQDFDDPAAGRPIRARGEAQQADEDVDDTTGRVTYNAELDFTIDPKVGIAALEFSIPTDVEQVEIPFDFKDLPFK